MFIIIINQINNLNNNFVNFILTILIFLSLWFTFSIHSEVIHKAIGLLLTSIFVVILWIFQTYFIFILLVYILAFIGAVLILFLSVVIILPITISKKHKNFFWLLILFQDTQVKYCDIFSVNKILIMYFVICLIGLYLFRWRVGLGLVRVPNRIYIKLWLFLDNTYASITGRPRPNDHLFRSLKNEKRFFDYFDKKISRSEANWDSSKYKGAPQIIYWFLCFLFLIIVCSLLSFKIFIVSVISLYLFLPWFLYYFWLDDLFMEWWTLFFFDKYKLITGQNYRGYEPSIINFMKHFFVKLCKNRENLIMAILINIYMIDSYLIWLFKTIYYYVVNYFKFFSFVEFFLQIYLYINILLLVSPLKYFTIQDKNIIFIDSFLHNTHSGLYNIKFIMYEQHNLFILSSILVLLIALIGSSIFFKK